MSANRAKLLREGAHHFTQLAEISRKLKDRAVEAHYLSLAEETLRLAEKEEPLTDNDFSDCHYVIDAFGTLWEQSNGKWYTATRNYGQTIEELKVPLARASVANHADKEVVVSLAGLDLKQIVEWNGSVVHPMTVTLAAGRTAKAVIEQLKGKF